MSLASAKVHIRYGNVSCNVTQNTPGNLPKSISDMYVFLPLISSVHLLYTNFGSCFPPFWTVNLSTGSCRSQLSSFDLIFLLYTTIAV